jgi:hypothetical protein
VPNLIDGPWELDHVRWGWSAAVSTLRIVIAIDHKARPGGLVAGSPGRAEDDSLNRSAVPPARWPRHAAQSQF